MVYVIGIIVQIVLFLAIPNTVIWIIVAFIALMIFSSAADYEYGMGSWLLDALVQAIPSALLIFGMMSGIRALYPELKAPIHQERLALQRVQPIVSLSTMQSVNGAPFGYVWTGVDYEVKRQTEDGGYEIFLVDGKTTRVYESLPTPEAAQIRYYLRQERNVYRTPIPYWVRYILKMDDDSVWHEAPYPAERQKLLVPRGSIIRTMKV